MMGRIRYEGLWGGGREKCVFRQRAAVRFGELSKYCLPRLESTLSHSLSLTTESAFGNGPPLPLSTLSLCMSPPSLCCEYRRIGSPRGRWHLSSATVRPSTVRPSTVTVAVGFGRAHGLLYVPSAMRLLSDRSLPRASPSRAKVDVSWRMTPPPDPVLDFVPFPCLSLSLLQIYAFAGLVSAGPADRCLYGRRARPSGPPALEPSPPGTVGRLPVPAFQLGGGRVIHGGLLFSQRVAFVERPGGGRRSPPASLSRSGIDPGGATGRTGDERVLSRRRTGRTGSSQILSRG